MEQPSAGEIPLPSTLTAQHRGHPAALGHRLAAIIYDLLPVAGILFVTAALLLLVAAGRVAAPGSLHAAGNALVLAAAAGGYYIASWRRGGQTLGARAWRLAVTDYRGRRPTLQASLLRATVGILGTALFGLGLLWSLIDRERRTWHDLASATRLVRLDPAPRQAPTAERLK